MFLYQSWTTLHLYFPQSTDIIQLLMYHSTHTYMEQKEKKAIFLTPDRSAAVEQVSEFNRFPSQLTL